MAELKIKIPDEQTERTLSAIVNCFNVGVKKVGNIIILIGHKNVIDKIRDFLGAKILDQAETDNLSVTAAVTSNGYSCDPACKKADSSNGCLGCPAA